MGLWGRLPPGRVAPVSILVPDVIPNAALILETVHGRLGRGFAQEGKIAADLVVFGVRHHGDVDGVDGDRDGLRLPVHHWGEITLTRQVLRIEVAALERRDDVPDGGRESRYTLGCADRSGEGQLDPRQRRGAHRLRDGEGEGKGASARFFGGKGKGFGHGSPGAHGAR